MRDTLLSTSAARRRSISDFSCTCGTRRRPGRGQILGPLDPTTCTLPNELTGPRLLISASSAGHLPCLDKLTSFRIFSCSSLHDDWYTYACEPLIVCHPLLGHLSDVDLPVPSHEGPHASEWVHWYSYVVQILPPLITTVVR